MEQLSNLPKGADPWVLVGHYCNEPRNLSVEGYLVEKILNKICTTTQVAVRNQKSSAGRCLCDCKPARLRARRAFSCPRRGNIPFPNTLYSTPDPIVSALED